MESYFKYCPIYSHDQLEKEYSLINLFSNQVTFSRRHNFNDLFDSKVIFKEPSRDRIRRTYQKLSGEAKREFKRFYMGEERHKNFDTLKINMEKVLDSYLFYCLTDNPINNLMWSHYANSHNGFCIEWDGNHIKPDKVLYHNELPSIDMLAFIQNYYGILSQEDIHNRAWGALKIKLREWEYEQEYRFQLGNRSTHLIKKDFGDFALVNVQPEWIKSIVFGVRMPQKTRDYIRNKLSQPVDYNEVIIAENESKLVLRKVV